MNDLNLHKSQRELRQSADLLRRLQLSAPHAYQSVAPRYGRLMQNQTSLERRGMSEPAKNNGQLGFVPLLIAGGIAATGLFAWLTSRQLTESTDYNARLKCVQQAMNNGASEADAMRICGFTGGGINFMPLAVAGVAGLALYMLLRK